MIPHDITLVVGGGYCNIHKCWHRKKEVQWLDVWNMRFQLKNEKGWNASCRWADALVNTISFLAVLFPHLNSLSMFRHPFSPHEWPKKWHACCTGCSICKAYLASVKCDLVQMYARAARVGGVAYKLGSRSLPNFLWGFFLIRSMPHVCATLCVGQTWQL